MSDRQANPTVAPPGRGTHCDSGGGEEASNVFLPGRQRESLEVYGESDPDRKLGGGAGQGRIRWRLRVNPRSFAYHVFRQQPKACMTRQTETLEAALPRAVGGGTCDRGLGAHPQPEPPAQTPNQRPPAGLERTRPPAALRHAGDRRTDPPLRQPDRLQRGRGLWRVRPRPARCWPWPTWLSNPQDGLAAEFGVSVLERVRGRGYGARLFEHAVMHARNRGVSTMVIYVARHNAPMLAYVRRAGAELQLRRRRGHRPTAHAGRHVGHAGRVNCLSGTQPRFDYQLKLHVHRLDRCWPLRGSSPTSRTPGPQIGTRTRGLGRGTQACNIRPYVLGLSSACRTVVTRTH
jgi:ribosomal protein S18 acetylase RimI-like enzyme